jgi:hypothetical protein
MWIFGIGNLMVTAPLIVVLKDRLAMSPLSAVLITTAIPLLLMPPTIPLWSRLLNRTHIVRFRAVHSWAFASATALILLGTWLRAPVLVWLASGMLGVAYGGGVLAWNLGHHDYAARSLASRYMAIHVTLTGIRGMVAPVIGICAYQLLEWTRPGSGICVFGLCLALNLVGAAGFAITPTPEGSELTWGRGERAARP